MYIPKHFEAKGWKEVVQAFPFATLVTAVEEKLEISHLPVFLDGDSLFSHFAKANEHWKFLKHPTKILFQGPNAYISPTWYEKCDVPTWNYVVVHLDVEATLLSREDTIEGLKKSSFQMEGEFGWKFEIPEDLRRLDSIVGVKFRVKSLEAKFKCSQNRSLKDFEGVKAGLKVRGAPLDALFLEWMEKIG
jgi:transcriptional regulator